MGKLSNIEWCDHTWNIARGCTKVDEDCKFCYMYRDSMNSTRYNPLQVVKTKTVFNLPLKIKKPSKIFTSSLSDFFHEDCDSFRNEAWDIIRKCPQHTFQILTKRPERIAEHLPEYWDEIKHRCWLGTSIGSKKSMKRALDLIKLRKIADVLFLSVEPLYSPLSFGWAYIPKFEDRRFETFAGDTFRVTNQYELLMNVDWVIVGGESGNKKGKYRYRPCRLTWIEQVVEQCNEAKTPVFVKQLGTYLATNMKLKSRHGSNVAELPKHLRLRQFPKTKARVV